MDDDQELAEIFQKLGLESQRVLLRKARCFQAAESAALPMGDCLLIEPVERSVWGRRFRRRRTAHYNGERL